MKRMPALFAALLLVAALTACKAREDPVSKEPEPESSVSEAVPASLPESDSDPEASENIINSGEENKEEAMAQARTFLEAVKSGDLAAVSEYIDYKQLLGIDSSNAESEQFRVSIIKRMDYTIDKARQEDSDGKVFAVEATIRNLNMPSVIDAYVRACAELEYDNGLSDEPLEQEELDREYARMLETTMEEHKDDTIENYVHLRLRVENGVWEVTPSLNLTDSVLGGYKASSTTAR